MDVIPLSFAIKLAKARIRGDLERSVTDIEIMKRGWYKFILSRP